MNIDFSAVDLFPEAAQKSMLLKVLRTRRAFFAVGFNGRQFVYKRSVIRDYLRGLHPDVKLSKPGDTA